MICCVALTLPPQRNSGNFADRSAIDLAPSIVPRYDDGYASSAPGGKFPANPLGIFDGAGNVSEWVNDIYSVPTPGLTTPQRAGDDVGAFNFASPVRQKD